jgi:hypothetical protein
MKLKPRGAIGPHEPFLSVEKEITMRNESPDTNKRNNDPLPAQQPVSTDEKKHKKLGEDEDTKNSGFRSTRIRESEKRTQDSGDPSIP